MCGTASWFFLCTCGQAKRGGKPSSSARPLTLAGLVPPPVREAAVDDADLVVVKSAKTTVTPSLAAVGKVAEEEEGASVAGDGGQARQKVSFDVPGGSSSSGHKARASKPGHDGHGRAHDRVPDVGKSPMLAELFVVSGVARRGVARWSRHSNLRALI